LRGIFGCNANTDIARAFWQVVMSTLQILTRPQEKSLRSVPRFDSQFL
jgi:hypothetical protein